MIGGDQCPAQQSLGFYELKGRNPKHLVLAFSGLQYERPPTFEFFQTYENRNIDVIFIRDSEHLWYQGGTDGALGGFETMLNYLQPKITGYEKVMTIGASMGAFAAMAAAVGLKGVTSCVAFSAQTFIDKANRIKYGDGRWPERMDIINSALPRTVYFDLRELYLNHYKGTPVYLFYGPREWHDKNHVFHMKDIEGIKIIEVKDADHWAAHALKTYGIYDQIIDQAITSIINIETPFLTMV